MTYQLHRSCVMHWLFSVQEWRRTQPGPCLHTSKLGKSILMKKEQIKIKSNPAAIHMLIFMQIRKKNQRFFYYSWSWCSKETKVTWQPKCKWCFLMSCMIRHTLCVPCYEVHSQTHREPDSRVSRMSWYRATRSRVVIDEPLWSQAEFPSAMREKWSQHT